MPPAKRMTAAEAAVLDAQLPAGLTEEMKDVAFCLFEAMANVAVRQLQHLADKKGGKAIYLAKGLAVYLSARDLAMCAEFRGNNYDVLAKKYDLTEMRVRQIVSAWQLERLRSLQGTLPGLEG